MMRLRYAGTCATCGRKLPAGTVGFYFPSSKCVRCLSCPTDALHSAPLPEPASPGLPPTTQSDLDFAAAGGSAQREHDRRAEKHESAVKARFGDRVGGVLLAVTGEAQSTRAWAQGARGERELAEALEGVKGIVVLNDRSVPGTRGNIDHIVIAPAGVFVIDAKRYKGELRIHDKGGLFRTEERLYVGGRDCSDLAEHMAWQVRAVETALAGSNRPVPVAPVLCFLGVEWPLLFRPKSFRGVHLAGKRSVKKLLTNDVLDAFLIEDVARLLSAALPAKPVR